MHPRWYRDHLDPDGHLRQAHQVHRDHQVRHPDRRRIHHLRHRDVARIHHLRHRDDRHRDVHQVHQHHRDAGHDLDDPDVNPASSPGWGEGRRALHLRAVVGAEHRELHDPRDRHDHHCGR